MYQKYQGDGGASKSSMVKTILEIIFFFYSVLLINLASNFKQL